MTDGDSDQQQRWRQIVPLREKPAWRCRRGFHDWPEWAAIGPFSDVPCMRGCGAWRRSQGIFTHSTTAKRQCLWCGGWFFAGREAEHSCGNTDEGRPTESSSPLSERSAMEIYGVACPVCKIGALRWINYGQAQCAMCNVTVGATIADKRVGEVTISNHFEVVAELTTERDRYKTRCEALESDLHAVMGELNMMVEQNGRFREELGLPQ